MGKTTLSIRLAKAFDGEIISGDSMQVYKGMDIGTAKVTHAEMDGVKHHMIDILEPNDAFTAADFKEKTEQFIKDIHARGKLPIIVGGSGLYIQSVLYGYEFSSEIRDEALTERLEQELEKYGAEALHARLKDIDPIQAEKIHPNNHRRLIRALEAYESSGKRISDSSADSLKANPDTLPIIIGLEMDRQLLYERINKRVDQMIDAGLIEEVKHLLDQGFEDAKSMRAIGYKEIVPYIKGEISFEEAVELLKRNSRRFAKRQYTWFRNKMDVQWYEAEPNKIKETFAEISQDLAGFIIGIENSSIQRERGGN